MEKFRITIKCSRCQKEDSKESHSIHASPYTIFLHVSPCAWYHKEINGEDVWLCQGCFDAFCAHRKIVEATIKAMWIAFMRNE